MFLQPKSVARLQAVLAAAFVAVPLATTNAHAALIPFSSNASGEVVSLTLTPTVGSAVSVTSGPLPYTYGNGASTYSNSDSALSATVAGVLSTGTLAVDAAGALNGATASATSDSTVNGVSIAVLNGLTNLLSLTASTVASTARVQGPFGTLTNAGTTSIANLNLNGVALGGASLIPGVNDVILSALGITVTLNKEVLTGTAASGESLAVNAIDVSFANVLATIGGSTGVLNGTIDIGNSFASITADAAAVPEPATLALLAGSVGLLATMRRKARAA